MEYTEDIISKPQAEEDPGPPTEGDDAVNSRMSELKMPRRRETRGRLCGIKAWEYVKYDPDHKEHPVRWCSICDLWMSLRSKHCAQCGKCVARYDHHCIWMGNCVGERSHGLFWWYLVCQSISVVWGLYYLESSIQWHGFDHSAWGAIEGFIWVNGLPIIVFLFVLLCSWLPICLLLYHTYLLTTNQTTWEYNRKKRISYLSHLPEGKQPFNLGILTNIRLLCCTPGLLKWRSTHVEDVSFSDAAASATKRDQLEA